jgi:2-polyprenyl-3-methyl-5-hydroxy-6-metoxy-1,4-benzoquinol methylase
MFKKIKNYLYTIKEWLKIMYVYPQAKIIAGQHFDYDAYWREKRGEKYMGSLGNWQRRRADLAASIILNSKGQSVNDIGSGAGEVLSYIKNKAHLTKAVCYDSSSYALEIAKTFGLETKSFNVNKTEDYLNINEADYTILFEILEHVPGAEELLKFSYDRSKMGVLFSVQNTGFIIHRFRLFFFGKFPLQWKKHPAEHLRFWTKKDLKWWLKAQGFPSHKIYNYVGVPILKDIWPNLFCAGLFVELKK